MLQNPYRPGVGCRPPYPAGRENEVEEFRKRLSQKIIVRNCVLTGLRGVGKTVLLTEFKNASINSGWLWTSNEVSESIILSEERIAYSQRLFTVLFLEKLSSDDSALAITKPVQDFPLKFDEKSVKLVVKKSGGHPYFIQFLCKEISDVFIQQHATGQKLSVPIDSIVRKLDDDFFSGRWGLLTDRQRELLAVIANLESAQNEFTVQEIVTATSGYEISQFGNSQVNQMLSSLATQGLVFKNRLGKYSLAVPQLDEFIRRQNLMSKKGEAKGDKETNEIKSG